MKYVEIIVHVSYFAHMKYLCLVFAILSQPFLAGSSYAQYPNEIIDLSIGDSADFFGNAIEPARNG